MWPEWGSEGLGAGRAWEGLFEEPLCGGFKRQLRVEKMEKVLGVEWEGVTAQFTEEMGRDRSRPLGRGAFSQDQGAVQRSRGWK